MFSNIRNDGQSVEIDPALREDSRVVEFKRKIYNKQVTITTTETVLPQPRDRFSLRKLESNFQASPLHQSRPLHQRPPPTLGLTPEQESSNEFPKPLVVMHNLIDDLVMLESTSDEDNGEETNWYILLARLASIFDEQSSFIKRKYLSSLEKLAAQQKVRNPLPRDELNAQKVLRATGDSMRGLRYNLLTFGETFGYQLLSNCLHSRSFRKYLFRGESAYLLMSAAEHQTIFQLIRDNAASIEYVARISGVDWRLPLISTDLDIRHLSEVLDPVPPTGNERVWSPDNSIKTARGIISFENGPAIATMTNRTTVSRLGHRYEWAFRLDGKTLFRPSIEKRSQGKKSRVTRKTYQKNADESLWQDNPAPKLDPRSRNWLEPPCIICKHRIPRPSESGKKRKRGPDMCHCTLQQLIPNKPTVEIMTFSGESKPEQPESPNELVKPLESRERPSDNPATVEETQGSSGSKVTKERTLTRDEVNANVHSDNNTGGKSHVLGEDDESNPEVEGKPNKTKTKEKQTEVENPMEQQPWLGIRTLSNLPANTVLAEYVGQMQIPKSKTEDEGISSQFIKFQYSLRSKNINIKLNVTAESRDVSEDRRESEGDGNGETDSSSKERAQRIEEPLSDSAITQQPDQPQTEYRGKSQNKASEDTLAGESVRLDSAQNEEFQYGNTPPILQRAEDVDRSSKEHIPDEASKGVLKTHKAEEISPDKSTTVVADGADSQHIRSPDNSGAADDGDSPPEAGSSGSGPTSVKRRRVARRDPKGRGSGTGPYMGTRSRTRNAALQTNPGPAGGQPTTSAPAAADTAAADKADEHQPVGAAPAVVIRAPGNNDMPVHNAVAGSSDSKISISGRTTTSKKGQGKGKTSISRKPGGKGKAPGSKSIGADTAGGVNLTATPEKSALKTPGHSTNEEPPMPPDDPPPSSPSSTSSSEHDGSFSPQWRPPTERVLALRYDAEETGNWTRFVRMTDDEAEANVEFATVSIGSLRRLIVRTRDKAVGWGSELVGVMEQGE